VAHNGRLVRYPDTGEVSRTAILRWIRKAMPQQKTAAETIADWMRRRAEKTARTFGRHSRPQAEEDGK
jgi:hypothetical protein